MRYNAYHQQAPSRSQTGSLHDMTPRLVYAGCHACYIARPFFTPTGRPKLGAPHDWIND